MALNFSFWQDKKVFLTGHTGFKGSWLSLLLQQLGAQVSGFSLPELSRPSLFQLLNMPRLMNYQGNLCQPDSLKTALQTCQPDIVIHMAAQALVRPAYLEPLQTFASNMMGTVQLLEQLRLMSQHCAILIVTSDKVYWNQQYDQPFQEQDPLGGRDPYSASKACAEWATVAYQQSFFHPDTFNEHQKSIGRARAGNVIGGGDWSKDRLLPDMLHAYLQGRPVSLRFPNAIRPWQHVLEPLTGYLLLCEKLYSGSPEWADAWNFGPSDPRAECTVAEVAEYLAVRFACSPAWVKMAGEHPYEAQSLRLDSSKALQALKWQPRLSLETALDWVADWYLAHQAGKDMHDFTQAQIQTYLELLK